METKRHVLVMTLLAVVSAPALAQSAADSAGIRQAALDYAEGYYAGDGARMRRALHPELAKRIVRTNNQGSRLDQMSALTLIEGTEAGYGTRTPADQRIANVRILDVFEGAASVRTEMSGWIDYMHVAKWNGRWVIVNVLWETKPKRG